MTLAKFKDDQFNITNIMISSFEIGEKIVGKGENAFSPFPTIFSKGLNFRGINSFPNDQF